MPSNEPAKSNPSIDPAQVAAIAREVIARLKSSSSTNQSNTNQTAASIDDRVITARTIEQLTGNPTQLFVSPGAVVTPAARDEARQRGITINHTVKLPPDQQTHQTRLEITDTANPQRARAVHTQLSKRGISNGSARVVLSDAPARDVHRQCTAHRERAVMVTSPADVRRFADELAPTVWVLDMKRLNITAAANVVTEITRLGKSNQ